VSDVPGKELRYSFGNPLPKHQRGRHEDNFDRVNFSFVFKR